MNNNTVFAVVTEQSGRVYVVETTVARATDGMVYGNVDSFFYTRKEAQEQVNTLMLRTRNAW